MFLSSITAFVAAAHSHRTWQQYDPANNECSEQSQKDFESPYVAVFIDDLLTILRRWPRCRESVMVDDRQALCLSLHLSRVTCKCVTSVQCAMYVINSVNRASLLMRS